MNSKNIHVLLMSTGKTIGVAESCTGGNIAHQITLVSGSSEYFQGGVVAYSNTVKVDILGVSEADIETLGAVSEEVAVQMAEGIRKLLNTDYAVSTTGVAGPLGGSKDLVVGTVWIGVSSREITFAKKFLFDGNRETVIKLATENALRMLGECISQ